MSKMGISCLQSYKGAQLFQSVGLSRNVVTKCFRGMANAVDGVSFDVFHDDALLLHRAPRFTSSLDCFRYRR